MPNRIQEIINQNIAEVSASADKYPGVVILHDLRDWSVAWMSDKGLKELNISLEEVSSLTMQEYHARFFNVEDPKENAPKTFRLMEENNLTVETHRKNIKRKLQTNSYFDCASMRGLLI